MKNHLQGQLPWDPGAPPVDSVINSGSPGSWIDGTGRRLLFDLLDLEAQAQGRTLRSLLFAGQAAVPGVYKLSMA